MNWKPSSHAGVVLRYRRYLDEEAAGEILTGEKHVVANREG